MVLFTTIGYSQVRSATYQQKIDSLISVADTLGKNPQKLTSVGKEILSLSKKTSYTKGKAYGNFNLALSFYYSNYYKKSISYLDEALQEKQYLKTNPLLSAQIHSVYGDNYHAIKLFPLAKRHYLRSVSWAKKEKKNIATRKKRIKMAYFGLTAMYFYSGKIDSALHYTNKYRNETSIQTKSGSAYLNVMLGNFNLHTNELDSASYYYRRAYDHLEDTQAPFRILALLGLGKVSHRNEEYNKALTYYKKGLNGARISRMETLILKPIADIHGHLGDTAKERKYLRRYTTLRDSLDETNTPKRFALSDRTLKEIKSQNEQKTQQLISRTSTLVLFSVGGFGIVAFFFYRRYKKAQENLSQKQQEIKSLQEKVNTAFEEVVELAKENAPSFLARFREVNPEVYQKLSNLEPSLTKSELKLCAMLWLGFHTKDIARYTNIQPKSVRMKTYRLRKKMELPKGHDLYKWVKNL